MHVHDFGRLGGKYCTTCGIDAETALSRNDLGTFLLIGASSLALCCPICNAQIVEHQQRVNEPSTARCAHGHVMTPVTIELRDAPSPTVRP